MLEATVDIETNGLPPDVDTVWCGSIYDHQTHEVRHWGPKGLKGFMAAVNEYDVVFGHNIIAFDLALLRSLCGLELRPKIKIVDTLLISRLQRPDRFKGHSAAAWGQRLGFAKVVHEDWSQYSPEMKHRNVEDVKLQYAIWKELEVEGDGEGWAKAHRLTSRLFQFLQLQAEYGWYVDQDRLVGSIATLNRWMSRVDRAVADRLPIVVVPGNEMAKTYKNDGDPTVHALRYWGDEGAVSVVCGSFSRVAFRPVDLDKNAEVKAYLQALGWKPAEWNRSKTTGLITSPKLSIDDPWYGLETGIGKLIAKRVQCKQRRGVMQGWLEVIRPDGRISPAVTGLADTSRLKHKTIVNIPRTTTFFGAAMRAVFAVPPGRVIVGADSAGNQVRQLAARMGNADYTKTVLEGKSEDGTDIHTRNQEAAGLKTRDQAKTFFYAFIYGAGDAKIGRIIKAGAAAGKALKAQFYRSLPDLVALVDSLKKEWRKTATKKPNAWGKWDYRNGFIRGLDRRPIQVDSEHKLLVAQLQSDEAIHMSHAYVLFHDAAKEYGFVLGEQFHTLIFMHDEIQVEVYDPRDADTIGWMLCEAIRQAGENLKIPIPHAGEYKVGANWSETH